MILMQIISANIGVQAYIFKLMKSTLSLRKYRCQKLNTTSELRVLITFSNDKFKLYLLHCNYTLINVYRVFWRDTLLLFGADFGNSREHNNKKKYRAGEHWSKSEFPLLEYSG